MPVTVREVSSAEDFRSFVELPYRLHRDETHWIPPPPQARTMVLDREQNPYFEHAAAAYFLAERDGKVVGQVIAHIDHALNEYQDNRWGLFGFFECEDDQEAANALMEECVRWLAQRGCDRMVGPLSFSSKEDPGILVEGYEHRPVLFQPWHPPYYRGLLEGCGLSKSMDVLWRELDLEQIPEALHSQLATLSSTIESRYGVTVRELQEDDIHAELERVYRFFPPIFETHWAYVPLTERELMAGLDLAVQFMAPGTLVAERDGELIGASMVVLDQYQRLTHENGNVTYTERKIDQSRFMFMAVPPQYRHLGVTPALCHGHLERAQRDGIKHTVIGWSVEDNEQMNVAVARLGLEVSRRHRVYEKELASAADPATSE